MSFKIIKKCKRCKKTLCFEVFDGDYCLSCSTEIKDEEYRHQKMIAEHAQEKKKKEMLYNQISAIKSYEIQLSNEKRPRQKSFIMPDTSNITPKGNYSSFITLDLETTGLNGGSDRILEIGALKYLNGKPVESFNTYINPGKPIPAEATVINGIKDDTVKDAPTISQVLPSLEAFLDSPILVAHNIEFVLKFLYYSGCKVMESKHKYIDTVEQSQRKIKKSDIDSYTLRDVCIYFGIREAKEHRALSDAHAVGDVFLELVDMVQH